MKVIVDAQLPKRLSDFLVTKQVDSRHTLELPGKNATPDQKIIRLADKEKRIVITKDSDFIDNYIFKGQPAKLLIVSTGNIDNAQLIDSSTSYQDVSLHCSSSQLFGWMELRPFHRSISQPVSRKAEFGCFSSRIGLD